MTKERIKEIQMETAHPNSISVKQALFKVWYECVQSEESKEMKKKEQEEQYNNMLSMLQETYRRLEHTDMISLRKQIKEVLTFKSE